jgi:hypothetical protein
MGLAYAVERITACWDEVQALAVAHYGEVASSDLPHELSLDRESYAQAEAAGAHVFVTARDGSTLVGYLSMCLRRHPHSDTLGAWQDAIYLRPESRQGWNAHGMIAAADGWLREHGVSVVYHFAPTAHDYGPLLRSLGYNPIEIVWSRHLHGQETAP